MTVDTKAMRGHQRLCLCSRSPSEQPLDHINCRERKLCSRDGSGTPMRLVVFQRGNSSLSGSATGSFGTSGWDTEGQLLGKRSVWHPSSGLPLLSAMLTAPALYLQRATSDQHQESLAAPDSSQEGKRSFDIACYWPPPGQLWLCMSRMPHGKPPSLCNLTMTRCSACRFP